jgi:hypothetical protein
MRALLSVVVVIIGELVLAVETLTAIKEPLLSAIGRRLSSWKKY